MPGTWLNDEVVNFYLKLLQKRSDEGPPSLLPTVFAFISFFYSQLTTGPAGYCYHAVQRWTLPKKTRTKTCVLDRELLLFPINHDNAHW